LYQNLRVQTHKVSQTKAAKEHAEENADKAENALEEMELQLEQLTLKNKQLEMTMSGLLEKWVKDAKVTDDTLQQCRQQICALKAKCVCSPDVLK
jgi:hypothetical protein